MNREEIFMVWAPQNSTWSSWVKPVLFAHMNARENIADIPSPEQPMDVCLMSAANRCTCHRDQIMPGVSKRPARPATGRQGVSPRSPYNALPLAFQDFFPTAEQWQSAISSPSSPHYSKAPPPLGKLRIPDNAPPVFLLDSSRRIGSGHSPTPGMFDNRSVSLPTDFPSASRMLSSGIKRVLVVQQSGTSPQEDLSHTLLRWQEAGIAIELKALEGGAPAPIRVTRPRLYKILTQRLLAVAGFKQSPLGGFGGVLPIPSSAG